MRPSPLPDGVLVIDKPAGMTSHDVVACVRRLTGQRRAGHTGTLDPMATGVLPIVLGRATRLARFFSGAPKSYQARVRFGWATNTYDAEGDALSPLDGTAGEATASEGPGATPGGVALPSREALERALPRFLGEIDQVPPSFSAKKIGGVPAHRLARRQQEVVLPPVRVHVAELRLLAYQEGLTDLAVTCSAGFYVRALAHDLGTALGCGAHLAALRRTRSGEFREADATTLDAAASGWADALLPLERLLVAWPAVQLHAGAVVRVRHGRELRPFDVDGWLVGENQPGQAGGHVRVLDPEGRLLAIALRTPDGDGWPLRPTLVLA
jgi:tRNA pseudouridine55 synthase